MALEIWEDDIETTLLRSAAEIRTAISAENRDKFNRLLTVCDPPGDAPGLRIVTAHIDELAAAYAASIGQQAASQLKVIVEEIAAVRVAVDRLPLPVVSPSSLMRRLAKHPAWGLLLFSNFSETDMALRCALGAGIVNAWANAKRFAPSLTQQTRRELESNRPISDRLSRRLSALRRLTDEWAIASGNEVEKTKGQILDEGRFEDELRRWYRNRIQLASDKAQQSVNHHRTQSKQQFTASCRSIFDRVSKHDHEALLIAIGALLGLRDDLIAQVPIESAQHADYQVAINVEGGIVKFHKSLFSRGYAAPSADLSSAVEAVGEIYVTPLPVFIATALRDALKANPNAATLGQVAQCSRSVSRKSRTTSSNSQIAATFARFRDTFGIMAMQLGIDAGVAAIICHDPRLVPTGKFYYARYTREELWRAAEQLYRGIGWGECTPFVPGLAGGSQSVPDANSVRELFLRIDERVEELAVGNSPTIKQLLAFSDAYSLNCASKLCYLLALRRRQVMPISPKAISTPGPVIPLQDKRTAGAPPAHAVPMGELPIRIVQQYWAHVRNLPKWFNVLEVLPHREFRQRVERLLWGESEFSFYLLSGLRPKRIGSRELEQWWSAQLPLKMNSGRHFLQNALRTGELTSREIDHQCRHYFRGSSFDTSVSTTSNRLIHSRICEAVDDVAQSIGIVVLPGVPAPKDRP